jgi:glutaredoxin
MIRHAAKQESARVMVYGADWCEDTTRVLRLLTQWEISHRYFDVGRDPFARSKVAHWNLGAVITPAVTIGALENPRLFKPKDEELQSLLYTADLVRVGPLLL